MAAAAVCPPIWLVPWNIHRGNHVGSISLSIRFVLFAFRFLGGNTERVLPSFHVHQSEFCLGVAYVGDGFGAGGSPSAHPLQRSGLLGLGPLVLREGYVASCAVGGVGMDSVSLLARRTRIN